MNLTPTEQERLTVFLCAQVARRNRDMGIRLSHPEAVALITDEMMLAARKDTPYEQVIDLAGSVLGADDVLPGVAEMVPVLCVEGSFLEGTKVMVVFDPIPSSGGRVPGEIITPDGFIDVNADRPVTELDVINKGDRDIQVRSHAHFFEVNRALSFDRQLAFGQRLDTPSGVGVRFEPGIEKRVTLVPYGGAKQVMGFAGLTNGDVSSSAVRSSALISATRRGYIDGSGEA